MTVALMIVAMPHALEDFHYGDLLGFGVALPLGVAILVAALGVQVAGILFVVRGRALGPWLLGTAGAAWCVGAVLFHGRDLILAGPNYRHGFISKLLEVLIIVLGATAAWLATRIAAVNRRKETPR